MPIRWGTVSPPPAPQIGRENVELVKEQCVQTYPSFGQILLKNLGP